MRRPILAIDGPAGAGKSTIARGVAARLGMVYIDTGAMYRAVALETLRQGVDAADSRALAALVEALRFEFRPGEGESPRLFVNDVDVTGALRSPEVTALASVVSTVSGVRAASVRAQRAMAAQGGGVVMEGRDIGTVVFPDAEVKVFLDATPRERARRRHRDLRRLGHPAGMGQVRREIEERDRRDSTRADSPLRRADDAIHLMTDGMTIEQVIERVTELVQERMGR